MSNVKKNINAKNEESKRIPLEEEVIKNFVNQCEAIYEDNKIPVTIRLEYPLWLCWTILLRGGKAIDHILPLSYWKK